MKNIRTERTPEQNLMDAIFGSKVQEVADRMMDMIHKERGKMGLYHDTPDYKAAERRRELCNRREIAEKYFNKKTLDKFLRRGK